MDIESFASTFIVSAFALLHILNLYPNKSGIKINFNGFDLIFNFRKFYNDFELRLDEE